MRMIEVNIFNTEKTIKHSIENNTKKYFCVSTDKAANPVNMMGASKRIMEMFLMCRSSLINITTARFANVAFSDGSLLYGFRKRLQKRQPIAAPNDIKRYFLTSQESGELCLMSCIFGENRDIFFPKLSENHHLISFSDIAIKYLEDCGYEPHFCKSEDEARILIKTLPETGKWPCLFTKTDTTGEKQIEEFHTNDEKVDMSRFDDLGVIKNNLNFNEHELMKFVNAISRLKRNMNWDKNSILEEFYKIIPSFQYHDMKKYLDEKM